MVLHQGERRDFVYNKATRAAHCGVIGVVCIVFEVVLVHTLISKYVKANAIFPLAAVELAYRPRDQKDADLEHQENKQEVPCDEQLEAQLAPPFARQRPVLDQPPTLVPFVLLHVDVRKSALGALREGALLLSSTPPIEAPAVHPAAAASALARCNQPTSVEGLHVIAVLEANAAAFCVV